MKLFPVVPQTGRSLAPLAAMVATALSLPLGSSRLQAGPPPGTGQWTQTLNEDFNGTSLNTSVWSTGMRWSGAINGELQAYRPENVTVAGGLCKIKIEKRTAVNQDMTGYNSPTMSYASGAIQTYNKWTQQYGYFEVRVKMPSGKGNWPAFWLLPDRGASTTPLDNRVGVGTRGGVVAMGNEIDVFEYMGQWQDAISHLSLIHCGYFWGYDPNIADSWGSYAAEDEIYDPNGTFHTYGLYWAPGVLTWYVDGVAVLKKEDPTYVAACPEYLILNCALTLNPWFGPNLTYADIDSTLPNEMQVDYVKVYSGTAPGADSGDIGAVGVAGSDSVNASTGAYTLVAGGANIGGTADSFHYRSRLVTGDVTVVAKVDNVTRSDYNAKGGIMMRQSVDDPGSASAFTYIPNLNKPGFLTRLTAGGATSAVVSSGWSSTMRPSGHACQSRVPPSLAMSS